MKDLQKKNQKDLIYNTATISSKQEIPGKANLGRKCRGGEGTTVSKERNATEENFGSG